MELDASLAASTSPTASNSLASQSPPQDASQKHAADTPISFAQVKTPYNHLPPNHFSDQSMGSEGHVFPIRSAIKVDPTQTPGVLPIKGRGRNTAGDQEYFPYPESPAFPPQHPITFDANHQIKIPDPISSKSPNDNDRSSPSQSQHPQQDSEPSGHIEQYTQRPLNSEAGKHMRLFSDTSSTDGNSVKSVNWKDGEVSSTRSSSPNRRTSGVTSGHVTARFKHIITAGGHAVITGREGDAIQRCEDEPIHIPGAVQAFGLLIALEEQEDGQLIVRVVSENSVRIIGYSPKELFELNSFCDILSEEQSENLLDHIDFIRDEDADPASNGPEVFTISIRPRGSLRSSTRRSSKLWCAMHTNPAHPELIICEFELTDDALYPLVPPDETTPEPPEDTLQSQPTKEEYVESTSAMSKPLRVLHSARKRKGEAGAMEVFNIMSQIQEQLGAAPNLDSFLKILVGVVKELTGFHRVMIYQFNSDFDGRVVTELVDPRATKDLYKGLNFPASDIPKQARDLYKINKVRLLYDRDLTSARLVCREVEDLETPLDLSFSYLRAMSPIHLKYLANMAVRSSMSISINAFGKLWGLISCHGYGSKGMRVSFPIRKMCRLVGDTASRNIENLSYASRLNSRKLINTIPTEANPSGYIIATSDDLLKLFDADCGLLSIRGETKVLGKLAQSQEALALLEYLRLRRLTNVVASQDVKFDFPDLSYAPGFKVISGLLLVPLTPRGTDFIVFFRLGGIREIKWAGNPYEKLVKAGTEGYLEPRKSFKTWTETVNGKCREWTEEQMETAAVLCLIYGKFIEVWRQKEAALHSSELTKILLANSAHEVRTPLNAIINYLEIALEGALDQETRENLSKSHSASKSLIYVINDLLDLTKMEEGQELFRDEPFDLPATFRDASAAFKGDALRKKLEYEVTEHPGIPKLVVGDERKVRQVMSNILANALQNTSSGSIRVDIWLQEMTETKATIEIVIEDTGAGMTDKRLDALFRDLEQVTSDGEHDLDELQEQDKTTSDGKNGRTLGLGLAIVARTVRNMDGQLRLKSVAGEGSRFAVQLSFLLPENENADGQRRIDSEPMAYGLRTPPPAIEDELTLVERGSSLRVENAISRQRSVEELQSMRSYKSGSSNKSNKSNHSNKSDVDRLIDAISTSMASDDFEREGSSALQGRPGHARRRTGSNSSAHLARQHAIEPTSALRSKSQTRGETVPEHLRTSVEGTAGTAYVTDSGTPLKAIKMPGAFSGGDAPLRLGPAQGPIPLDTKNLEILVAEDDPINSKILQKRLGKCAHTVHVTINGEQCATAFKEKPSLYDVVLMDMQMPVVDGLTSTQMIRAFEKVHTGTLSARASMNGRVPIFAVSASLVERERQKYIDAGFDGWILKPVDFKRLNILLEGIVDDTARKSCLYQRGRWECGGWLRSRQACFFERRVSFGPRTEEQIRDELLEGKDDKTSPMTFTPQKQFLFDDRLDASPETPGAGDDENNDIATPLDT